MKYEIFKYALEEPSATSAESYLKGSAKAKAIINLCMEDSQIFHIKILQNPKDIWDSQYISAWTYPPKCFCLGNYIPRNFQKGATWICTLITFYLLEINLRNRRRDKWVAYLSDNVMLSASILPVSVYGVICERWKWIATWVR